MTDAHHPFSGISHAGDAPDAAQQTDVDGLVREAHALIFDCDGTLLKTPDLYAAAWQSAFANAGLQMDLGWYHERAGMSEHVLLDAFEGEKGVPVDRARAVRDLRRFILTNMGSVEEIPEIAAIARAHHARVPMAVASGGSREIVHASLQASGLLHLFDAVVTIDDVGTAKPAPDLFLEAASRLQTKPQKCLVFEDSPQGIEAAKAADMKWIDVKSMF